MSLLCGKNPALEAINSAVSSLKAQLSGGKDALSGIKSLAASVKSGIGSLKAIERQLESFPEELASLANGASASAIAALKAKWGSSIPDFDGLIKNIGSLDFCKDVPNIAIDPATGAKLMLAKTALTPNTSPIDAKSVAATVVNNFKLTSSGKSKLVPAEVIAAYQTGPAKSFTDQVSVPLTAKGKPLVDAATAAETAGNYSSVKEKIRKTGKSYDQLIVEGQLDSSEVSAAKAHAAAYTKLEDYNQSVSAVGQWWTAVQSYQSGNVKKKDLDSVEKKRKTDPVFSDYLSFFDAARSIADSNSTVIKNYAAVTNNRAAG